MGETIQVKINGIQEFFPGVIETTKCYKVYSLVQTQIREFENHLKAAKSEE